jgi:hypothetical protein
MRNVASNIDKVFQDAAMQGAKGAGDELAERVRREGARMAEAKALEVISGMRQDTREAQENTTAEYGEPQGINRRMKRDKEFDEAWGDDHEDQYNNEERWVTQENKKKKPGHHEEQPEEPHETQMEQQLEQQQEAWSDVVSIKLKNEGSIMPVAWRSVEAFATRSRAASGPDLRIDDMVRHMMSTGKISPNLGFGNEVVELRATMSTNPENRADMTFQLGPTKWRKSAIKNTPLEELWPLMQDPTNQPVLVGFTGHTKGEYIAQHDPDDDSDEEEHDGLDPIPEEEGEEQGELYTIPEGAEEQDGVTSPAYEPGAVSYADQPEQWPRMVKLTNDVAVFVEAATMTPKRACEAREDGGESPAKRVALVEGAMDGSEEVEESMTQGGVMEGAEEEQ